MNTEGRGDVGVLDDLFVPERRVGHDGQQPPDAEEAVTTPMCCTNARLMVC